MPDAVPPEAYEAGRETEATIAARQGWALAGIFCRSGVPHEQPELGTPPCAVCIELAEYAMVAVWSLGVAEGRRLAAEAIRAEDAQLHASATMEWAARIAEGNTDATSAMTGS